jgi:hypothetical protein
MEYKYKFGPIWCEQVRECKSMALNPQNRHKLNAHAVSLGLTDPEKMNARELCEAITFRMGRRIKQTTERVAYHHLGINVNYSRQYRQYRNPNFNNQLWHADQVKFFRIGLSWPLFDYMDFYYDGNTLKTVTILGIEFGIGDFTGCEALEPMPKEK